MAGSADDDRTHLGGDENGLGLGSWVFGLGSLTFGLSYKGGDEELLFHLDCLSCLFQNTFVKLNILRDYNVSAVARHGRLARSFAHLAPQRCVA